jgi:DNA-binding transcriptional MerR regulator
MSEFVDSERRGQDQGIRMKDLVAATGLPKSTILYYLGQGLLPEPEKPRPNVAFYDPRSVDRIKLIRHLQKHHRLSISEIHEVLRSREGGPESELRLELNEVVFGPIAREPENPLGAQAFCAETGLTGEQLQELLELRLLLPLQPGRFDREDVRMGRALSLGLSWGIRASDLAYYAELGQQIVDQEVQLRSRITGPMPHDADAAITIEMVHNARVSRTYVIERLFQHRVMGMKDIKDEV